MATQTQTPPNDRHARTWRRIRAILARLTGSVPLHDVEQALGMLRTEVVALMLDEDTPLRLVDDEARRALERSYDEVLAELDGAMEKVAGMNDGISVPIGAELTRIEKGLDKLEDEASDAIRALL